MQRPSGQGTAFSIDSLIGTPPPRSGHLLYTGYPMFMPYRPLVLPQALSHAPLQSGLPPLAPLASFAGRLTNTFCASLGQAVPSMVALTTALPSFSEPPDGFYPPQELPPPRANPDAGCRRGAEGLEAEELPPGRDKGPPEPPLHFPDPFPGLAGKSGAGRPRPGFASRLLRSPPGLARESRSPEGPPRGAAPPARPLFGLCPLLQRWLRAGGTAGLRAPRGRVPGAGCAGTGVLRTGRPGSDGCGGGREGPAPGPSRRAEPGGPRPFRSGPPPPLCSERNFVGSETNSPRRVRPRGGREPPLGAPAQGGPGGTGRSGAGSRSRSRPGGAELSEVLAPGPGRARRRGRRAAAAGPGPAECQPRSAPGTEPRPGRTAGQGSPGTAGTVCGRARKPTPGRVPPRHPGAPSPSRARGEGQLSWPGGGAARSPSALPACLPPRAAVPAASAPALPDGAGRRRLRSCDRARCRPRAAPAAVA
uniref:Gastrulation brain homeobox 1 n=1 Tax=Anas platyrhynchos platyrhynchos TaxID=8840 RepID=A0A493TX65_ANAPP